MRRDNKRMEDLQISTFSDRTEEIQNYDEEKVTLISIKEKHPILTIPEGLSMEIKLSLNIAPGIVLLECIPNNYDEGRSARINKYLKDKRDSTTSKKIIKMIESNELLIKDILKKCQIGVRNDSFTALLQMASVVNVDLKNVIRMDSGEATRVGAPYLTIHNENGRMGLYVNDTFLCNLLNAA